MCSFSKMDVAPSMTFGSSPLRVFFFFFLVFGCFFFFLCVGCGVFFLVFFFFFFFKTSPQLFLLKAKIFYYCHLGFTDSKAVPSLCSFEFVPPPLKLVLYEQSDRVSCLSGPLTFFPFFRFFVLPFRPTFVPTKSSLNS